MGRRKDEERKVKHDHLGGEGWIQVGGGWRRRRGHFRCSEPKELVGETKRAIGDSERGETGQKVEQLYRRHSTRKLNQKERNEQAEGAAVDWDRARLSSILAGVKMAL